MQMVRLLVEAGADVNAAVESEAVHKNAWGPVASTCLWQSKAKECCAEILSILIGGPGHPDYRTCCASQQGIAVSPEIKSATGIVLVMLPLPTCQVPTCMFWAPATVLARQVSNAVSCMSARPLEKGRASLATVLMCVHV